eukprot:CAMPEP_0181097654 /NCGR_PEP_ID=MMETSP1071-20121207/11687_1 /TAXON_ID=35127 /ORGANISM="Thalassiosira sp., Strain NH16" /LENGTH=134 /DNA_ID=CAMNT_0023180155 /DNA_START=406 /DNA_END=811 /DNA_ORIENTATION=+
MPRSRGRAELGGKLALTGWDNYDREGYIYTVSGILAKPSIESLHGITEEAELTPSSPTIYCTTGRPDGLSLPSERDRVEDCRMDELKGMIVACDGSVMGRNGKALSRSEMLNAYLSVENETPNHTVYFNHSHGK